MSRWSWPGSETTCAAGDVIAVEGQGEGPFEIAEIRDGPTRRISARALPPVVEAAIVTDRPRTGVAAGPVARAIPLVVAAHLPPEPDSPSHSRLMLAATASPWPGRITVNAEATGGLVTRIGSNGWLGTLAAPLASWPTPLWDVVNAVEVALTSGHLAAASDDAVLAGANRIAVRSTGGAWEIIGFVDAELTAPGLYRLTRLLRGQGGTAAAPAEAGTPVAIIDGRIEILPVPSAWLGETVDLRAYAGDADPTGAVFEADLDLAPMLPLAPVHLRAMRDGASGDVTVSWIRRSRADSDSWSIADAPLDHAPERYRVTILDGPSAVRQIECDSPGATYAAAAQTADFGELPGSFGFTVSQLSTLLGTGHPATGQFDA